MTEDRFQEMNRALAAMAQSMDAMRRENFDAFNAMRLETKQDRHKIAADLQTMVSQIVQTQTRMESVQEDIREHRDALIRVNETFTQFDKYVDKEFRDVRRDQEITKQETAKEVAELNKENAVRTAQISLIGVFLSGLWSLFTWWKAGH